MILSVCFCMFAELRICFPLTLPFPPLLSLSPLFLTLSHFLLYFSFVRRAKPLSFTHSSRAKMVTEAEAHGIRNLKINKSLLFCFFVCFFVYFLFWCRRRCCCCCGDGVVCRHRFWFPLFSCHLSHSVYPQSFQCVFCICK